MNKIIYLKDHKEKALEITLKVNGGQFKKESILAALDTMAKGSLKYNTQNGTTYFKNFWIDRPSSQDGFYKFETVEEIIEWQFAYEILNTASKLERGFKAV